MMPNPEGFVTPPSEESIKPGNSGVDLRIPLANPLRPRDPFEQIAKRPEAGTLVHRGIAIGAWWNGAGTHGFHGFKYRTIGLIFNHVFQRALAGNLSRRQMSPYSAPEVLIVQLPPMWHLLAYFNPAYSYSSLPCINIKTKLSSCLLRHIWNPCNRGP